MNKIIVAVFLLVVILITGCTGTNENQSQTARHNSGVTVYFFYGEECPHCHNVMPFIQGLNQKYPDADIQIREVWHNQTNYDLAHQLLSQQGQQYKGVPLVIVGNRTLIGDKEIPEKLEEIIAENTVSRNNNEAIYQNQRTITNYLTGIYKFA